MSNCIPTPSHDATATTNISTNYYLTAFNLLAIFPKITPKMRLHSRQTTCSLSEQGTPKIAVVEFFKALKSEYTAMKMRFTCMTTPKKN